MGNSKLCASHKHQYARLKTSLVPVPCKMAGLCVGIYYACEYLQLRSQSSSSTSDSSNHFPLSKRAPFSSRRVHFPSRTSLTVKTPVRAGLRMRTWSFGRNLEFLERVVRFVPNSSVKSRTLSYLSTCGRPPSSLKVTCEPYVSLAGFQ